MRGRFVVALGLAALSCGPKGVARNVAPVANDADGRVLSSDAVEVVEAVDLPTIQIVRRRGDPHGSLGVAVFTEGGSVEAAALTALMSHRLKKLSIDASFRTSSEATLFIVRLPPQKPAAVVLKTIHRVLHESVSENETEEAHIKHHFQALLEGSDEKVSEVGLCSAELGAEGRQALKKAIPDGEALSSWLEKVRRKAVVASRIGLAAVGEGALTEEVKKLHSERWTAGAPIDDSWSGGTSANVLPGQGARELRIALRLADTERALSAGRALRDSAHPLRTRLRGYSSNYSVNGVWVTLRPAGACLSVRVVLGESSRASSLEQLSAVSLLVTQELESAAEQSLSEEERSLALVEPKTADETAALAAWSAVRSPLTGASPAQLIEYRDTSSSAPTPKQLSLALERTRKTWEEQTIELKVRDENGQPQLHMTLATPCGTLGEPPEETGLRALTVSSLAKQFSGHRGIDLIPFIQAHGVGLIARGSRMKGETASEHAQRVGQALAAALSGVEVDGRAVAEARSEQLRTIGSDPGAELIVSVFGGDAVSSLEPLGNENVVSALSTNDVERSREELAQEPLRLAVLANEGEAQAQIAERAISRWLGSEREHARPCLVSDLKPTAPGQWTLETLEEHVSTGAYIGAWAPVRPEVGEALAHYLWERPELLKVSSSHPPPPPPPAGTPASPPEKTKESQVRAVDVVWRGNHEGGALITRIGAADDALVQTVEDTRLALQELSVWGLSPEAVEEMRRTFQGRRASQAELPIGRVVDLWTDQAQSPPTARELKVLTQQLAGNQHRIVLVKRRK